MNILVKIDNNWVKPRLYQKTAFKQFKRAERNGSFSPIIITYNNDGIKFTIKRIIDNEDDVRSINSYGATYLIREDGSKIPIIDTNDIYVFLPYLESSEDNNWHSSRNYQKWAYMDYIYDTQEEKFYKSRGSSGIGNIIDINNLEVNIKFKMSRNSNQSIFVEKNDVNRSRIRICDCLFSRQGYQGFFNRMTAPIGMSIDHHSSNTSILPLPPNLKLEKTDDDEELCCICYEYKQNIKFLPCNHTNTCSQCYLDNYKHNKKNICSICKQDISKIILL
tara:strand:- start:163 stop:993 length:831 start_codon:yes stop_codon:yes gene_type:complete